jgi:hypothetical protein
MVAERIIEGMLINELILHSKQFTAMAYPNRTHSLGERKNTVRHRYQLLTHYLMANLSSKTALPETNKKRRNKKKRKLK